MVVDEYDMPNGDVDSGEERLVIDDEKQKKRHASDSGKSSKHRSSHSKSEHHDKTGTSKSDHHSISSSSKHRDERKGSSDRHDRHHKSSSSEKRRDRNRDEKPKTSSRSSSKRRRESDSQMESPPNETQSSKRQKCDTTTTITTSSSSSSSSSRHDKKRDKSSSSKSSSSGSHNSSSSKPAKQTDIIEIDNSMGTSFADALGMYQKFDKCSMIVTNNLSLFFPGMIDPTASSSKSSSKHSSKHTSSSSSSSKQEKPKSSGSSASSSSRKKPEDKSSTPALLSLSKAKLPPLEDLSVDLPPPTISNNYKPMPLNPVVMSCVYGSSGPRGTRQLTDEEALSAGISTKTHRTKVYSGIKSGAFAIVPSLHERCIRLLQKNIDALKYTGGVPFEILKPVLDRASADQLLTFEHYNSYLMDDSDTLWEQHCKRKFRGQKRREMETWREMYYRCLKEQEAKLNSLTENIKHSQTVAVPVRQTKLAYVDSMPKPPRNVIRAQNQNRTERKLVATPASRVSALNGVATNMAQPGDARLRAHAAIRDTVQMAKAPVRPKKAPLMAKTLQMMRGLYKR